MKLVALCFLFALAISQTGAQSACYAMDCSELRFLNVLPPLGSANVTFGSSVQVISNAAPGSATEYSSVNANTYRLRTKFQRGGQADSQPHSLGADKHYTLITKTNGNALENVLVGDDVRAPRSNNTVLLRAGNFLSENTVISISDQRTGRTLFRNLEYGEISNWKEIPSADYTLIWSAKRNGNGNNNNKRMILQGNWTCCRFRASSLYVTPSGTVLTSAKTTTAAKRSEDAVVPEFLNLAAEDNENENNSNANQNNNKAVRDVKTETNLSAAQAQAAEKVEASE